MAASEWLLGWRASLPGSDPLTVAGIMNYVYDRDYAVLVRLKVPPDARGTVPIRAQSHWLACTDKIFACRSRANCRSTSRWGAARRAARSSTIGVGRFPNRWPHQRTTSSRAASCLCGAPACEPFRPRRLRVPDHRQDCRLRGEAVVFVAGGDWLVGELRSRAPPGTNSTVFSRSTASAASNSAPLRSRP